MRPQVGQLVNNKYRLLRLIGDGGMGSVFEARHEVLGTSVALKFLHAELTRRPGLVQRFLQEARVVARIQSPHVVRVSDVDQTPEGNAFIVMEFIEGKSLQALYEELYRAGRRLSYADAMDYALQMLDGLEAAHAAGIVHRDLKPDNVMITRGPKGASLLKILDFGIAKLKVEGEHMKGLTRPGVVMGTPEYMAPEQAFSADQVDARADIFAFGVMLFEMLAGRRPVGGDEPHQIAAQYLGGEVAKLTDLAPQVPAPLAEIVHKAMAAQAKDRWDSVVELRRAIEAYAEAAKPGAPSPSRPSDRPRSSVKDGEANPSSAAQVMAAVGAASEADGGATDKVDGPPAMMLVGGGTAGGLGPGAGAGSSPHVAVAASPIVAPSPAGPSPAGSGTQASSPAITPVPGIGGAPWATEPAELDPLRPGVDVIGSGGVQRTSTEGFSPLDVRPGGTDVAGTAIDPRAPSYAGTAPMTPAGGFVAPPPPQARRRKKSGGLAGLLFAAATITGAVLGGVFLWDRLDLGEGSDPAPITTTEPAPIDLGPGPAVQPPASATTPPPALTSGPPAAVTTTAPAPPPPPPATTPPRPPATTPPRPPATTPPSQPTTPPPPALPTLEWPPAPTVPTLPPLIPITPPQPQPQPPPEQPRPQQPSQPQPQPTHRPTIPWRPKLPGRSDAPSTDAAPDRPAIKVLPRPGTSSRPRGSTTSRPRVVVPKD
jgi:serine/threonine-protein kinase